LKNSKGHTVEAAYFIGIGGIGMSAIARYFGDIGIRVLGYDKTETELTKNLTFEGVKHISFDDDAESIPEWFKELNPENCLVVYTPAIPSDSKLLAYFQNSTIEVMKRSELLGLITQKSYNLSIAGTHGKTTTSCLLSSMLNEGRKHFTAFLGGISSDFHSNYIHSLGADEEKNYTVTEADEYDRSFLRLSPKIVGITSMDADHLDIYGEADEIEKSFNEFANLLPETGYLFHHASLENKLQVKRAKRFSYGIDQGDIVAMNLRIVDGHFMFDCVWNDWTLEGLEMGLPGTHNIENALLAMAIAKTIGVEDKALRRALKNFKGVKRRFEYIVRNDSRVFIDDYAHHPTELKSIISSVRLLYPDKKIVGVFQPHLFSRTRDFMAGFAQELSQLDELILLDIYPAREMPIKGVTSSVLLDKIEGEKSLVSRQELIPRLKNTKFDVLLTLGAGDIDQLVDHIKSELTW
jgi:UDP-N-acetylmuramate--alanine ligase